MSITGISLLTFLPGMVVLVAQWVGILAMRGRKNMAWLLMLIGVSIATVGTVVGASYSVLATKGLASAFGGGMTPLIILGMVSFAGSLSFAVGFALHGLTSRSALERQEQLESMAAAMASELETLRNRGS